jgi:hypothetical protein
MYVSINRQLTVLKISSALYLGFARERVKRGYLISKVFAGNITLWRN